MYRSNIKGMLYFVNNIIPFVDENSLFIMIAKFLSDFLKF
uniref:Uncharacterized protein n=1 Tax=Parascaris equorum TaxID=6256 RepID=A0A914S2Y0_PAREQ